tara:strand:- start:58 stop:1122 length:1065 start_codon:yes stop_codon:yes gene_type:complete
MSFKIERNIMRQATRLAELGHGTAEPNPLVGCIITNENGEIVGEGYHKTYGQEHAEVNALAQAGASADGGTAYITLEPCNHHGKTPPCSEALIAAGIKRVVIGTRDPHENASGGIQTLQNAGVQVTLLNDSMCQDLLAPFTHRLHTGLPWITCKWAQTKNGELETAPGESPWISCSESQWLVHQERGCVDAIMVGVGTVVSDNPKLTVRNAEKFRIPKRIVIDPSARIPRDASILSNDAPTLLVCKEGSDYSKIQGCEFIEVPIKNDLLELDYLFKYLVKEYDMTHIMVEGGGTLFKHVFQQKLVNEIWAFQSPFESTFKGKVNMNSLMQKFDSHLIHEEMCGVDIVSRYIVPS